MPDCKGQRNMLRRVGTKAARPTNNAWLQGPTEPATSRGHQSSATYLPTRQIYGVSALA